MLTSWCVNRQCVSRTTGYNEKAERRQQKIEPSVAQLASCLILYSNFSRILNFLGKFAVSLHMFSRLMGKLYICLTTVYLELTNLALRRQTHRMSSWDHHSTLILYDLSNNLWFRQTPTHGHPLHFNCVTNFRSFFFPPTCVWVFSI